MTQFEVANAGAVSEGSGRAALLERRASSRARWRWETLVLVAAGLAGLAGTVASVALTAAANPHDQLAAVGYGLVAGVPVAVALYACRRGPYPRFAHLLLAAAVLWSFVGLAQSMHSIPYSSGRVVQWLVEPLVIVVALAFPSGRLREARERAIAAAAVATVAILYLPTALLVDQYPAPAPWTSCDATCPHNAFMVSSGQPAFVSGIVYPAREVATQLVFLAMVVVLVGRMRGGTRLMRRAQGPLLTVAIVHGLSLTIYLIERSAGVTGPALTVMAWIWLLSLAAIAVAFLIGILRWRLFTADALQRLALGSAGASATNDLRHSLASALDDPSLRVLYRVDTGTERPHWVQETGEPAALPAPGSGLDATELVGSRGQVLAIVHDEALSGDRELVRAAGAHVLVALENEALQAQVRTSLRELRETRAQALAAGEQARRKIRQNLHDGAQQRLLTLLVRLELAGPQIERDPTRGARLVQDLADEVEQTLAEIRVLSHGLEPSLLTDKGLVQALAATVADAPLPTVLEADGVGRFAPEVEECLYFVCMEALSNVYKHALGATAITICVRGDDVLELEVTDDGDGFDPATVRSGLGMASMRERLATVGGRLAIDSAPGRGARLIASVPLRSRRASRPRAAW